MPASSSANEHDSQSEQDVHGDDSDGNDSDRDAAASDSQKEPVFMPPWTRFEDGAAIHYVPHDAAQPVTSYLCT